MITRTPKFTADGAIECEIEHPRFGVIPFTASPDDPDATGRAVFAKLVAAGGIAAYVAPPAPVPMEDVEIFATESDERAAVRAIIELLDPAQKGRIASILAGDKAARVQP